MVARNRLKRSGKGASDKSVETRMPRAVRDLKARGFSALNALEYTLEDEFKTGESDGDIIKAVEKVYGGKVVNYGTSKCGFVPK